VDNVDGVVDSKKSMRLSTRDVALHMGFRGLWTLWIVEMNKRKTPLLKN
jgi:hypothetical protein